MGLRTRRALKVGSASAICLAGMAAPAAADDTYGDYLGEIELGTSKREVQTGTAAPLTVINQEEIDDRQANTVAELIDSVPGVTLVNGSTPQGSGINIRGFGANGTYGSDQKVLVLIDGATTGAEELYRIGNQLFTDPLLYKSVSVNRGTVGSFEFGSGVVGGTVILETKDASDFTGGEVGLRFNQHFGGWSNGSGFSSSSTLVWQPSEQAEFLVNYSLREQDDQTDGGGTTIGNSAFRLPSYLVKGKYSFGSELAHSVTASYNDSSSAERDVPYDSFGTTGGTFGNVDRDIHTRIAGLKYEYHPIGNDLVDVGVNLTYSDQQIHSTYIPGTCGFPNCDPVVAELLNADHRYETTKLTARNTAFFQTGAVSHDLRAGVEFIQRDRLDANSAPGGSDQRVALFAVDDLTAGGLTVTPAIRYETQNLDGDGAYAGTSYNNNALMGGLSVRYEFATGMAVFGSAAYTESLPIIDDLGTPVFMTQPEKSTTYEAGLSYARFALLTEDDGIRFKANFYQTRLWDVTSYSPVSGGAIDYVDMRGLELEASYITASGVYVDLNANITDGTELDNNGTETRWRNSPANSARLLIGKRFDDAWDLSWEIVGNQGVTDANDAHVPGWAINNLRATFRPQGGVFEGTEIRASVENALDHNYTPYLSTRPAVGRNLKLAIAKTF